MCAANQGDRLTNYASVQTSVSSLVSEVGSGPRAGGRVSRGFSLTSFRGGGAGLYARVVGRLHFPHVVGPTREPHPHLHQGALGWYRRWTSTGATGQNPRTGRRRGKRVRGIFPCLFCWGVRSSEVRRDTDRDDFGESGLCLWQSTIDSTIP